MRSIIKNLSTFRLPFLFSLEMYVDLGTSTTRIALKDKGVVYSEPSYIGINRKIKEYIFYGTEAKTVLGKTPEYIKIVRPITNGVLYDFDAEVAFLQNAIDISIKPYLNQHKVIKPPLGAISCAPNIATEIEQRAIEEVLTKAGCHEAIVIEKALATAAGCGIDIFSHEPRFVIDLGGGLIELSIVSGGGVVAQKTIKQAGEHMNKMVVNYCYLKHGMVIGEATANKLKEELLSFKADQSKMVEVRGKSLESGLPKEVKMKSTDIREALISQFHTIVDNAKELFEQSPPEIVDSIYKQGVTLAGGLASIPGIDTYFSSELQIETVVAPRHKDATIYGLMKLSKDKDDLRKIIGTKI